MIRQCLHKPINDQIVIFTWQSQCVYASALLTISSSRHTPAYNKIHKHTVSHSGAWKKERRNNPRFPWEQMSPAKTSDRLPQPTARLKVLCRAEGGHYCGPFCTGGNRVGSEEAAGLNTALTNSSLLAFIPLLKCSRSHFNWNHLELPTVCHLVAVAWNNTDRELRGEFLQIGEKMTRLTHAVNALTETESAHADPSWIQLIISLLLGLSSGRGSLLENFTIVYVATILY